MKKLFLVAFAAAFTMALHAQTPDSTYAYLANTKIPPINIMQADSSWFAGTQIPKNKPVIIVYFSPECGHCQLAAQEIYASADKLKDAFFVWITYYSVPELKTFEKNYKIGQLPNFRFGRDPNYSIPSYYKVRFTPFMAVYDTNGKFVKAFEQGASPETLVQLVNDAVQKAKVATR